MNRRFSKLNHTFFVVNWSLILFLYLLPCATILAQTSPQINTTNGVVPNCITEEQTLSLIINGSNFAIQANGGAVVRIRGTAFTGEVLFTPEPPNSATQIKILIPARDKILSNSGTLTIDVQQSGSDGNPVFSNTVQVPVYPKTGPISGAATVCGNTQNTYTIPNLPGAASYEWSVISGNAAIVSGGTSNTARISFTNTFDGVKISVKTINTCGTIGSTSTMDVQVNATPTVTLPAFDAICANAPSLLLTSGSPAGGTYTVDGVVATSFNPSSAGVGEHAIIYYYTQNGCSSSATQIINVLSIPAVTFSNSFNPICLNTDPITLMGGSPAGGTYSGKGISGTTFNPAIAGIGTHAITYTITQNSCTASASQIIQVLPTPAVGLAAFSDICVNAPVLPLTGGTPAGGTYMVDGVAATSFNPNTAGMGEHTITYNFTQNGCLTSATQKLRVLPVPSVIFPVTLAPICVNAQPLLLSEGLPASGTYNGPGLQRDDEIYQTERFAGATNSNFSYNIPLRNDQYTVKLHFAEIYFTTSGQRIFDVNLENNKVLDDYDIFRKVGANTATTETFTINIIDGFLDIDFIGLISEGGKDSPKVSAIEVLSANTPSVSYRINAGGSHVVTSLGEFAADNYFLGGKTYSTTTTPIGGIQTSFNPAIAGVGEHTITYSVTQNGCQNSATKTITVLDRPLAQISVPTEGTQTCPGQMIALTANLVANAEYQWFLNGNLISGAVSNTFEARVSGNYTVQITDANCPAISDPVQVIILDPSNLLIEQSSVTFCDGSNTTLHALTGNGYQYKWLKDEALIANETNATLLVDTPGNYQVIVTPAGCNAITSSAIHVTEVPALTNNTIKTTVETEICAGSTVLFSGSVPSGGSGEYIYQWQSQTGNNTFTDIPNATSSDYNYLSGTITGSISFRRVVISGACSSISNEINISVNQAIANNTIVDPPVATICAGSEGDRIVGSTYNSGSNYTFAWESSNNGQFVVIPDATSANFTPSPLTQTTTFRRVVILGECTNISNAITITVIPNITGNNITVPSAVICRNSAAEILTGSTVTGGNGTFQYAWESSLDGKSFKSIPDANTIDYDPGVLTQTTTFRRVVTSGECRDVSNLLTIMVNPIISGNNIKVTDATICIGSTSGNITGGSLTGGTGEYTYVWESSLDNLTFTTIPNQNTADYSPGSINQTTTYRRIVTSGVCADTSNAVTITVEPIATYTVFLTVAPSSFPVCGETQYTAQVIKNVIAINYPADPRYQQVTWRGGEDVTSQFLFDWWKNDAQKIATGNTRNLEALLPGEYYTVRARFAAPEMTCFIYNNRPDLIIGNASTNTLFSNKLYAGQPEGYSVSISSDLPNAICPGAPITFSATPNDLGYANQSYQWVVNGQDFAGATQATFTTSELNNKDVVSVRFSSDENSCDPITAENPISLQVADLIQNRLENLNGPDNPEVGKEATYQVVPLDNTINWMYRWTISYTNGQEEIVSETGPVLKIASVRADLKEIKVEKIAPAGSCVNQEITSISTLTVPLPIELLYLTAKNSGQDVILEWATATEQNNSGFEVQVSSDAVKYRTLNFVHSKNANVYTKQLYTYTDRENGKAGTRYYRLKQINYDGSFAYSGIVATNINTSANGLIVYPNPFTKEVNLEINAPDDGDMHLVITNAIGSKVAEQQLKIKKGTNKEVLLLNPGLPAGMYTVIIQINDRIYHSKILKN